MSTIITAIYFIAVILCAFLFGAWCERRFSTSRFSVLLLRLLEAARSLRQAQTDYMAHRGDDRYGQRVAKYAGELDAVVHEIEEVLK